MCVCESVRLIVDTCTSACMSICVSVFVYNRAIGVGLAGATTRPKFGTPTKKKNGAMQAHTASERHTHHLC